MFGICYHSNPRLYRFKEKCLRFTFQIQYLPGKFNATPDCMSKLFDNDKKDEYSEVQTGVTVVPLLVESCQERDSL